MVEEEKAIVVVEAVAAVEVVQLAVAYWVGFGDVF